MRLAAALAVLAAVGTAQAQSFPGFGGGMGGGLGGFGAMAPGSGPGYVDLDAALAYIDNADLSATHRRQDEIGMAGIDTNYDHRGGLLDVRARGTVDWIHYWHHTLPSAPYGALNADATWGRSTGPAQWFAQETFNESLANPLAAPNLSNLEYVNHFATGPAVNLHLGATDRLSLHALYSNTTYQRSAYGSNSYDGGAVLAHAISRVSSLSLAADEARTVFTNQAVAPTYTTRNASLSYDGHTPRAGLTLTAGYTELDYSGAYRGAPMYQVQFNYQLSAFSSIDLSGRSGYSTSGQAAGASFNAPLSASVLAGLSPATSSAAPFKSDLASLGWYFHRARTSLALSASYDRQRYASAPLGYASMQPSMNFGQITDKNYSATLTRQLRPTLSVSLDGYRSIRRIDTLDASTTESMYGISVAKRFFKASLTFYVRRLQQSAAGAYTGLGAGAFQANTVGIQFTYDLIGQRAPTGP